MIVKYNKDTILNLQEGDDNVANGYEFVILGKINDEIYADVTGNIEMFFMNNPKVEQSDIFPQELFNGKYVKINNRKQMLKENTRKAINGSVGDIYDLIADLSKRVALIERLLLRVTPYVLKGKQIPDELKNMYLPMIEQYIQMVDNGMLVDRIDLEDTTKIFQELIQKNNKISEIVKKEYLDKK